MQRNIPVDGSKVRFIVIDPAEARTDNEGVQRTDRDGRPLNAVPVLAKREGERSETLIVSVPGSVPNLPEFSEVKFEGLRASMWSMNNRSGISYSAEGVSVAGKPAAAAGGDK